ncbi:MAG TPA: ABC transporter permease [Chryseolinea sp.]|nr:ABC transporter permease [Chryseolinea sp.]
MFLNNLRLALRHLVRQRLNTFLHIVGLTLGMSVCLLIGLFLRYELSFDTYHNLADRTYRINSIWIESGNKSFHYSTPMPLADALRNEVAGLEAVVQAHPLWDETIEVTPQKILKQEHLLVVDPSFPDVFNIEVIKGNANEALRKPYQALLTETTAKKFYGDEDPIGKTFTYKKFHITVAGLIRDFPSNTHLPASMLLSYVADEKFLGHELYAWTNVSGTTTYVVLPNGYDKKDLEAQLQALAEKNINSDPNIPKFYKSEFDIQPLRNIHFNAQYEGGGHWIKAVNTSWLWFFAIIGFAVLALACINFVNLSTAQALTRAKEVGVRKSVGAGKLHLIAQFLREAWILTFISGVLSVAIAQMSLPFMNTLLEKGIKFNLLESPGFMISLLGAVFLIGLMAGLYPAWIIARFNPVKTLKAGSTLAGDQGSYWLRRTLVVLQFTISASLLIAVTLISQQVNFLRSASLGFDKDNIINVTVNSKKNNVFSAGLESLPQIKDVAFSTSTPSSSKGHWGTNMSSTNRDDPNRKHTTLILADDNYCKMYGLKLLAGRFLKASDTTAVSRTLPEDKQISMAVVNEQLVRELGFKSNEDAIEKPFWFGMNSGNVQIVGVVADFNTGSLHDHITPATITSLPGLYDQAGIKIEAGSNIPETIAAIEKAWKKAHPEGVFEFQFLDAQIDTFYKAEERLYQLFKIFAGLAMLISCLGLWGLSTLSAQQRTKEIGIRKVLGASVDRIVVMLSKDFLIMVLIALAIASPLAHFLISNWLQSFAFHIDIGWQVFAIAGIVSLVIALFTVSFQAIKAALANPVESLRNE